MPGHIGLNDLVVLSFVKNFFDIVGVGDLRREIVDLKGKIVNFGCLFVVLLNKRETSSSSSWLKFKNIKKTIKTTVAAMSQ